MPIDSGRDPAKNTAAMRVAAAMISGLMREDLDAIDADYGLPDSEVIIGLLRFGGVLAHTAAEALRMSPEDFMAMVTLRLAAE